MYKVFEATATVLVFDDGQVTVLLNGKDPITADAELYEAFDGIPEDQRRDIESEVMTTIHSTNSLVFVNRWK